MEKILCAAIWYMNIGKDPFPNQNPINVDRGIVFCGYRHPHCMYSMLSATGLKAQHEAGEFADGFLTNKNRFVDRKEAAKIFIAEGGKLNYHSDQLFSEDLYQDKYELK